MNPPMLPPVEPTRVVSLTITGHIKLLLGLKWQNKVNLTIVQLLNQLLFGNFVPVNMLTNHLISNDVTPLAYGKKYRNHLCKELIDVIVVLLAITDLWFWDLYYDSIRYNLLIEVVCGFAQFLEILRVLMRSSISQMHCWKWRRLILP